MYRKFSQGWFKHFDFIVIDLLCVQFSFFAAAFWRHGGFPYYDKIYVNTGILLFFIDVLTCIFFSTYANVLRRGFLKEFKSTFLHTCEVSVGVLVGECVYDQGAFVQGMRSREVLYVFFKN